jgi:HlyD family secretion protein
MLLCAVALGVAAYALTPQGGGSGWTSWSTILASWAGRADTPRYRTAEVERGRVAAVVNATGSIQPVAVVAVGSQVSGQIRELRADYNSEVRKDEVIAVFDPEPYRNAIEQAEAELRFARAAVKIQRAALDRTKADLAVAQADRAASKARTRASLAALADYRRDLERKKALATGGTGTAVEKDRAQTAFDTAHAVWEAAEAAERAKAAMVTGIEAQLRSAESQIESALASVDQKSAALRQARTSLDRSIIRSPVDGTVIDRMVEAGQIVAASLEAPVLFTIARDLREMQIKASVDEADIGRIRVGQKVAFTVDAFPDRTFRGEVGQIRKNPVVTQYVVTYTVVVSAPNPDLLLLPGMTANVRILLAEREDVLRVPNAALRVRMERTGPPAAHGMERTGPPAIHVWVLDGAEPRAVPVRAGLTDGTYTEVAGPLEPGQPVVVGREAAAAGPEARRVFGAGL